MPTDLVIEIDNEPGALAQVAQGDQRCRGQHRGGHVRRAGASGPSCTSSCPTPTRPSTRLAIAQLAVTREREVVVVEVDDRPGVLADLARDVAEAGVDLDLVYVATRNRVVFGAADLDGLKAALQVTA